MENLIPLVTLHHDPSLGHGGKDRPQGPCCVSCVPCPIRSHRYVWRGLWEGGKEVQRAIVHQGEGERDGAVSETDQ